MLITSIKWFDDPYDVRGFPYKPTFAYEIDARPGYYAQETLRKVISEGLDISKLEIIGNKEYEC